MAEPLKNYYGAEIPRCIARMIRAVHPAFDDRAFLKTALKGYGALELMPRGAHIAEALHAHLPHEFPAAIRILLASVDQPAHLPGDNPIASFLFLPHTVFVAKYGLEYFDLSMQAQHTLTQRFTAEFSIRPFLQQKQSLTLNTLHRWASDPSEQVRRLVSEGTRPRLPWAGRLRAFQRDPGPVLALLELLKDDPSLYVRRSVANNLNDIGKDHPDVLIATARRWMKDADANRRWIIHHALRSAVKRGDTNALAVIGFGSTAKVALRNASVAPTRVKRAESVTLQFELASTARHAQQMLVDLRIHYAKANGSTSAKVFKLRTLELAPAATATFSKRLSLRDLTTRKHYPGVHRVEALVNGQAWPIGSFQLLES